MKRFATLVLIINLWFTFSCNSPETESRSKEAVSTSVAPSAASGPTSNIDRILDTTASFEPVYRVLENKDVSFKDRNTLSHITRKTVNISLPEKLDKATLEANLKFAAKELYAKEKPDALIVYGYGPSDSTDLPYTIAMLTFAPYGDWGRAGEKPALDKYQASIEIRNEYLKSDGEKLVKDDKFEKQALDGDYQAQRNLAFSLSTGSEGYTKDPILACAWRIVILKSGRAKADASDTGNKESDCEGKLNPQQMREAETQANSLLKRVKKQ